MDAWLVKEYVWELPLDMPLTICTHLNLNNTLPWVIFFVLGLRRAGLYHGLRMPVLRFLMWFLSLIVLVFQIIVPSKYACGLVAVSFFRFWQAVNLYEPGFGEMFSSLNGLMAFALSSPYLLICGGFSVFGVVLDRKAAKGAVRMKKFASWFWFLAPVLLFVPCLYFIDKLTMVLAHRVSYM